MLIFLACNVGAKNYVTDELLLRNFTPSLLSMYDDCTFITTVDVELIMIKKTLSIFALSILPALAFSAGGHTGEHNMPTHGMEGHDMSTMSHAVPIYGQPGDSSKVSRNIEVTMDDSMRFTPSKIDVKEGETVRFLIKNAGKTPHEMVIGSLDELKAHAAEMLTMPDMQHTDPGMITINPGELGELVWQFDKMTTVDFACLIPGHTEAGMTGKIHVK